MFFTNTYARTRSGGLLLALVLFLVLMPASSGIVYATDPQPTKTNGQAIGVIDDEEQRAEETNVTKFGCFDDGFGAHTIAACSALATYYFILKPAYIIAGGMSMLFNLAFFKLVVGMGTTVEAMPGITTAWMALRDIGNIFLVFLLVYVGISTILGLSGYGYKRILWKILVAALLVNFSITFTKLVIDITNIAAIEMYDTFIDEANYGGISVAGCLEASGKQLSDDAAIGANDCIGNGLAGVFWTELRVTSIFAGNSVTSGNIQKSPDAYWNMAWSGILGAGLLIILAFVFGATAFFLVARFIILVFLIVVSPIALIAAITGVGGGGSKWLRTLINQSVFAPLILLMWWVAFVVMQGITGTQSLSVENVTDPTALSTAMTYIVVSGFLIAGLFVAKHFGAHGSGAAINMGQRWAKAAVYGTAGFAAANSVGWASRTAGAAHRRATESMYTQDAEGNYINNAPMARLHRNFAPMRKVSRGMQNTLDAGSKKRFFGTKSLEERRKGSKEADEKQVKDINTANRKRQITKAVKQGHADTLRKATINEIEQNADDLRKNPSAVHHLSGSTYKKLKENKNNKFTDDEIRTFENERKTHLNSIKGDALTSMINKTPPKELAEHDPEFLGRKEVVEQLDTQTLAGMHKSGLSKEKREAIRSTVEKRHQEIKEKVGGVSGDSSLVGPDGKPLRKTLDDSSLTPEEKNIVKLHEWLNDDNKMAI